MSAVEILRVTRLSHRFGLTLPQAALVAGLFWEGAA